METVDYINYVIIIPGEEGSLIMHELEGRKLNIRGVKCGIYCELVEDKWGYYDFWSVTDLETGMQLSNGLSEQDAIDQAVQRLVRHDVNVRFNQARMMLKEKGIKLPVNPFHQWFGPAQSATSAQA